MKSYKTPTLHAVLRRSVRESADRYLDRLTGRGWSDEQRDEATRSLAKAALVLYLHERGMKAQRRESGKRR